MNSKTNLSAKIHGPLIQATPSPTMLHTHILQKVQYEKFYLMFSQKRSDPGFLW